MKVIWLSRHDMTRTQEARLRLLLPEKERDTAEIVYKMQVWQTTADEESDNDVNSKIWLSLAKEADVIVGVFPPAAIVGLLCARSFSDDGDDEFARFWTNPMVLTPISQIESVLRGGSVQKQFSFLRWQHI